MEGFCNTCDSSNIDVSHFSCSTCKYLWSGKTDDGRFYRCENEDVDKQFSPIINSSTIYKFACNKHEEER